jgi:acyl-CoA thioester hydrolase
MKSNTNEYQWSETRVRVRYAETDQAGMVYHSNYLIWFEIGRVELCRAHGFNYRDMELEADAYLPVTEARLRYRIPAKYDDVIVIRTRAENIRSRAITFVYEVRREADDTLLAEGETQHIVMNRAGRARSFPAEYAEKLSQKSGKV